MPFTLTCQFTVFCVSWCIHVNKDFLFDMFYQVCHSMNTRWFNLSRFYSVIGCLCIYRRVFVGWVGGGDCFVNWEGCMCLLYSFLPSRVCVCVGVWDHRTPSACLLSNLWLNLSDRCGPAGTDLHRYEDKSCTVLRKEGNSGTSVTNTRISHKSKEKNSHKGKEETLGTRKRRFGRRKTERRIQQNVK